MHTSVAWSYQSHGIWHLYQENTEEAINCFNKCLQIRQDKLGSNHAYTAEAFYWLGVANEKTEKGEYCVVLDLHGIPEKEAEQGASSGSVAARLADAMDSGMSLREAQEALIRNGEKKNAVKQAALRLKKAVSE